MYKPLIDQYFEVQKTAQSHPLKTAIPVHFSIIRFYLVAKILFFPS